VSGVNVSELRRVLKASLNESGMGDLQRGGQVCRMSDPDDASSSRGGASARHQRLEHYHESDPFLANLNSTIQALRNVTFFKKNRLFPISLRGVADGGPLSKKILRPSGCRKQGPK
jgi:hypothetical protein